MAGKKTALKPSPEARRELFVRAYLGNGLNATEAAKAAGYSAKTAGSQASRMLKDVNIAAAIAAATETKLVELDYSVERVLREVARIAFLDPAELFGGDGRLRELSEMSADARAAIAGLEVERRRDGKGEEADEISLTKLKIADKGAALDKLMRYHSLYKDKVTVEVDLAERIAAARARRKTLKG